MSAGWSRVRIFNPAGAFLAELNTATKRSWMLNDVGRCTFTIPTYDGLSQRPNPVCTEPILHYGNFVLVEHKPSQDADGLFNGTLPPWIGFIYTPRVWEYGKVSITAYSAENLLKFRAMPIDYFVTGTPGTRFTQILGYANQSNLNDNPYPVLPDQIFLDGPSIPVLLKSQALDEIKSMVKTSNNDWDVTQKVDQNNKLSLYGNWYNQKGIVVNRVLSNQNTRANSGILVEQGDFFNVIRAYSDQSAGGNRNFSLVADADSVAANGVLSTDLVLGGTADAGDSAIAALGRNYLVLNGKPTRTLAPSVLDRGQDFSYLAVGNTWQAQLDSVGFNPQGGIGVNGPVRIIAMEYDDLTNEIRVAALLL